MICKLFKAEPNLIVKFRTFKDNVADLWTECQIAKLTLVLYVLRS